MTKNSLEMASEMEKIRKVGFLEKYAEIIMPALLVVADWASAICAGRLAFFIRNTLVTTNGLLRVSWLNSYVVFPIIFITFFHVAQLYQRRMQFWKVIQSVFYSCIYANVTIIILLYVTNIAGSTSRLYVFLMWLFSFIFTISFRYVVKKSLEIAGVLQLPVLMIGAGKTAGLLLKAYEGDVGLGYKIVGVLDDFGVDRSHVGNVPYLGTFADTERVIKATKVKNVIIAAPGMATKDLNELIYRVQPLVRNLSFVPNLIGLPVGGIEVDSMYNEKMMVLRLRNNLARSYNRHIKFIFDMALTILGTVCISPILFVLAVIIRLDSRGPIIFSHKRVGKNGKIFPCYKFRTMCVNAQEKLNDYLRENPQLKEEWERDFKLKDDPRVTKVGKFLRKTSLDELPQIFNVLKGEMSLVGPRPIIKDEVVKYGNYINDYYMVRPGITGMWQVSGRSDTTYEERVAMDSWYVRNWSVWIDVVMLFRTFKTVVKGQGAY